MAGFADCWCDKTAERKFHDVSDGKVANFNVNIDDAVARQTAKTPQSKALFQDRILFRIETTNDCEKEGQKKTSRFSNALWFEKQADNSWTETGYSDAKWLPIQISKCPKNTCPKPVV